MRALARPDARWGVVPPPPFDSGEPFDGYRLLLDGESSHNEKTALFAALRRALYYAPTPFDEPAAAGHAWRGGDVPEIPGLTVLLGSGLGERTPDEVADACLAIAAALGAEDHPFGVRAFTRAAAILAPERADAALAAAHAMLETGDRSHGEIWLRRAITGARRTAQWRLYTEAHLQLTDLLFADRQMEEAQHVLTKALRAAKRNHFHDLATRAHLLAAWIDVALSDGEAGQGAERLRIAARKHLSLAERSQVKATQKGLGFTSEIHARVQTEKAHIEAVLATEGAATA